MLHTHDDGGTSNAFQRGVVRYTKGVAERKVLK